MFSDATSFYSDLEYWNVSSATSGGDIFQGATLLNAAGWFDPASPSFFLGQTTTGNATGEIIMGDKGNDVLSGLDGDDEINGGDGWDKLTGGAGDDILDGGEKNDTAMYSGKKDDYLITEENNILTIQDLRDNSPDGTDSLTNIEFIKFSDQKK